MKIKNFYKFIEFTLVWVIIWIITALGSTLEFKGFNEFNELRILICLIVGIILGTWLFINKCRKNIKWKIKIFLEKIWEFVMNVLFSFTWVMIVSYYFMINSWLEDTDKYWSEISLMLTLIWLTIAIGWLIISGILIIIDRVND